MNKREVQKTLFDIGYGRVFTVSFLKKDGTLREMTCMMDKPVDGHKRNPDVVPVMELESERWKSFRLDSVVEIR